MVVPPMFQHPRPHLQRSAHSALSLGGLRALTVRPFRSLGETPVGRMRGSGTQLDDLPPQRARVFLLAPVSLSHFMKCESDIFRD